MWSAQNEIPMGEVMPAEKLWALARPWFQGRLAPDWKAKSTDQKQQMLTDAGFIGSFWMLP